MGTTSTPFAPDYAIAPGEILEETLEARGMTQAELAKRCGLSKKTVNLIVSGNAPVTPDTALMFEKVLSVSAVVWSNLETDYRLALAREAEAELLAAHTAWARQFPLRDLRKRGIVTAPRVNAGTVSEVLDFLNLANLGAWDDYIEELQLAARRATAFKSSPFAVAAWLRLAEMQIEGRGFAPYDAKTFRSTLHELRDLTDAPPETFEPAMREKCAACGVAVAFVGELEKTHISGATRWLHKDLALLVLSLRHKSDDHFWFSFFHEAGHILLHGKRDFFLDEDNGELTTQEKEANRFAADMLIPRTEWRRFTDGGDFDKGAIIRFARELGIAPGIAVGRLQKEKFVAWTWHNGLKRRFELVE